MDDTWAAAVRTLGGTPTATDLVQRYAEPHRAYHNATHVDQVVRDAAALSAHLPARDRAILTLAALAHDVIYDGAPGDDERRSAGWARHHLTASGVPEPEVARVEGLILATITHDAPDDLAAVLLDADLAVLASPDYETYRGAVRREYAHVPDEVWRTGRAAVLRSLLAKDPLYRIPAARDCWEAAARANVSAELATLEAGPRP